jgi:hypothetical protein
MRIARIAAIGAGGVAAVIGAKKLKQARSAKNGTMPTEKSDIVEDGDSFLDSSKESL